MMQDEDDRATALLARSASVNVLAREFLSLPGLDVSIEQRAYMVESTLPTLVLALEKLLMEASRNGSIMDGQQENSIENYSQSNDHIPLAFDPINWLGQYLYRNNPAYSNFSDASPYIRNVHAVAKSLKAKLYQMQGERIARLKAQKNAHDQAKERRRVVKEQQRVENNRTIQELTTALIHKLVRETWCFDGLLDKSQLLDILRKVGESSSLQEKAQLIDDINQLCKYIETTFDGQQKISASDPLFIDQLTGMTVKWKNRDFNDFVRCFSVAIAATMSGAQHQFKEVFAALEPQSTIFANDSLLREAVHNIIGAFSGNDENMKDIKRAVQKWSQDRPSAANESFQTDIKSNATSAKDSLTQLLQQLSSQYSINSVKHLIEFLGEGLESPDAVISDHPITEEVAEPLAQEKQANDKENNVEVDQSDKELLSAEEIIIEVANDPTKRPMLIKALFQRLLSVNKGQTPELATRFANRLFSLAAATCVDNDRFLVQSLITSVPMLTIMTDVTTEAAFIENITQKLIDVNNEKFELILGHIQKTAVDHCGEIFGADTKRQQAEDKAIKETAQNVRDMELSFQKLCTSTLDIMMSLLQNYHRNIHAKIFLLEANPVDTDNDTSLENSVDSLDTQSQHGVLMACTDSLRVGSEVSAGIAMDIAESGKVLCLAIAHENPDMSLGNGKDLLAHAQRVGAAVLVPVKNKDGDTIGLIQLDALDAHNMSGHITTAPSDVDLFESSDVQFAEVIAEQLGMGLDILETRSKTAVIAESSAFFLKEQADADTEFFIVEGQDNGVLDAKTIRILQAEPLDVPENDSTSRFLRPPQHRLSGVKLDNKQEFLFQAALNKQSTTFESDGVVRTAVPIMNDEGQVVALVVVRPNNTASTGVGKQDMEEVLKVVKVLGKALTNVRKQGLKKVKKRKRGASATYELDEDGELVFAKYMLNTVRESISELDSSSMAELKSYKKPPPTIHKVLKCILYLFGKTPQQVNLWNDTVKFVNMDLLKQMMAYDPISLQKKSRFARIRKVLKTIPHGDVKKKGSLPAQTVFAWLLVTLDLRDRAVSARKRANVSSSAPETAEDLASTQNEDEDGEDSDGEEA